MKMKKLLAVLLALLLLCGGVAMAQSAGREAFVGNWELHSITLMGITLERSELSYDVICNIHEDDTVVVAMGESYFVKRVSYVGNTCVIEDAGDISDLTIDEEGLLCLTLTSDGVAMDMRMQRAAASVPAAEIAPMVGQWELASATIMGMPFGTETLGTVTAAFYPDHYGQLTLDGDVIGAQLFVVNGAVQMDEGNYNSPVYINEEGQLIVDLLGEDGVSAMVLTMNPIASASASTAASAAAPAADGSAFDGRWNGVTMSGMDGSVVVDEGDIWMDISGDQAEVYIDGSSYTFPVTLADGVCTLAVGDGDYTCTINERGQLELRMVVLDTELLVVMEPEGGLVTAASGYDGVWELVEVEAFGITMSAEEAEVDTRIVINGTAAKLYYDGDTRFINCTATVTDAGLELFDGEDTLFFTLNEAGQLCMKVEQDGLTMTLRLDRQVD